MLLICDQCYETTEPVIKKTIDFLQKMTYFDKIPKEKNFMIMNEQGVVDPKWTIHPRYLFFIPQDNTVYFPLIKDNLPEKWVSLRHLAIMNDVVIC